MLAAGLLAVSAVGVVVWASRPQTAPPDHVLSSLGSWSPAAALPSSEPLSLLVWNVEKGKEQHFSADFSDLTKSVHLCLVQEYLGSQKVQTALLEHGLGWNIATSFVYSKSGEHSGTAIGSRVEPTSVAAKITDDTEPIVGTPKSAILATYAFGDTQLLVVCVHGRNRGGLEPFVKQLAAFRDDIQSHVGPVILAGDFNTNSGEKQSALLDFASKLGLTAVQFSPDKRTLSKLSRRPLDWAFVRELHVESAAAPGPDVISGSDHQPLIFKLRIIGPQ